MAKKKKNVARAIFLWLAFLGYVALMLWLLFGQRLGNGIYEQQLADGINLEPFSTLRLYFQLLQSSSDYLVGHAFVNLAGNVAMFIPLGMFLPGIFRRLRGFFKTFFFSAALIITVEIVQYYTLLGSCDVDDLILNLVGVTLGYGLYRLCRR